VITAEDGTVFKENLLFTHRGLSGPAVLQISSYWQAGSLSLSTCCRSAISTVC
jgi:predicted flavoprotein YhiN